MLRHQPQNLFRLKTRLVWVIVKAGCVPKNVVRPANLWVSLSSDRWRLGDLQESVEAPAGGIKGTLLLLGAMVDEPRYLGQNNILALHSCSLCCIGIEDCGGVIGCPGIRL